MQHKLQLPVALTVGLLWGCSGSGSSGDSTPSGGLPNDFQLVGISVRDGETWRINRPIEMEFSRPVDFSTVSTTTIRITSTAGLPASGVYSQKRIDTDADGIADTIEPTVIIWQPACPILPDFSDAGLRPGGFGYQLVVTGIDRSPINVLRSSAGRELRVTQVRDFTTPLSSDPSVIFIDPVSASPVPLVRPQTSSIVEGVCYLEIGSNPSVDSRIYFERPLGGGVNTISPGAAAPAAAPLNSYADPNSETVFVLFFDQPVNPSLSNINSARIGIEYRVQPGGPSTATWIPIETEVELVANCNGQGAEIRLRPMGGLPADSAVRVNVRAGFEGLLGNTDSSTSSQARFAETPTLPINNSSLANSAAGADGLIEDFLIGGTTSGSRQDTGPVTSLDPGPGTMVLSTPATWGSGSLTSRFEFSGDGGPSGSFDWYVDSGGTEFFDTSSQSITSGVADSGVTQFTTGGVVNVRDFIIEDGSSLIITGPNPLVINATGMVRIEGTLDLSGLLGPAVASVNIGNVPVVGGAGIAGGGNGGSASSVTNTSTPRGSRGLGAFGVSSLSGGQGGESGSAVQAGGTLPDNRRPGGGAGGAFNVDQNDSSAKLSFNAGAATDGQISEGMMAQPGFRGHIDSRGAETDAMPSEGGLPGVGPFQDADNSNNFFGRRADVNYSILADRTRPVGSAPTRIISGELSAMHAGSGGGGGGDALNSDFFPTPNWSPASDERGGPGGGGAGALRLRALGPIIMSGLNAQILCKGGRGGTGENSFAFDQVGGTGGSGSGGHVILESGAYISFVHADISDQHLFIDARGGRENKGRGRDGSANNNLIPGGLSDGGQGGPGLIQLHVPNSNVAPDELLDLGNDLASRLILPQGTIDQLDAGDANALNEIMRPAGVQMIPTFSAVSSARSDWVDIGAIDVDAAGGERLVQFLFGGIDSGDGSVLTTGGMVTELPALLGPAPISASAQITAANTLVLSGTELNAMLASSGPQGDDIYLRTPALLRNCLLRMTPAVGSPVAYNVEAASYENAGTRLTLDLSGAQDLSTFSGQAPAPTYTLVPRFFGVSTGGNPNALPDGSSVRLSFDFTGRNPSGNPDESSILLSGATDFSAINLFLSDPTNNGKANFFRLNFAFDLNSDGGGLDNLKRPVSLDFVRLPYSYE